MAHLDDSKAAQISQAVENELEKYKDTIRGTYENRTTPATKRDILHELYYKIHIEQATRILGTKKAARSGQYSTFTETIDTWQTVHHQINKEMQNMEELIKTKQSANPTQEKDLILNKLANNLILELKYLTDKHIHVPIQEGWYPLLKWCRAKDYHMGQLRHIKETCKMTDEMAIRNPKKLTRQICKPHGTTHISSLRKGNKHLTTDKDIEQELTEYLAKIAGTEEQLQSTTTLRNEHPNKGKINQHLKGILNSTVSPEELRDTIRDLDAGAGAGIIAIQLIKIATSTPWETKNVKKTNREIKQETHTRKIEQAKGQTQHTPISPTHTVKHYPTRSLELLRKIAMLSLKARDIPLYEKKAIVTGLPKKGGHVDSTDNIRPISVSPIIGRIINNIIARRLGAALEKHKILDPAGHAFLPGGNIHQPLDTIIQCLTKSKQTQNNEEGRACYAVFYDISKAYDSIKWSSIQKALIRIGAPDDLIEFVLNCLRGTQLCMKTNIPGRTTPKVQLHKSIKQGCPLAPLLFIIVMDELHAELRKIGGYKLDDTTTIASQGFCDDTVILAEDMITLQKMNNHIATFFRKHSLNLNQGKTYFIGRTREGKTTTTPLLWPGAPEAIKPRDHGFSFRYLGLQINMNLDWGNQIGKMNGKIMGLVSHLKHRRITLAQGIILIRYALSKQLEIGFRHADIPLSTLRDWDKWIKNAITNRADIPLQGLHQSAIRTTICTLLFEYEYILDKTIQLMETLPKRGDTWTAPPTSGPSQ